MDEHTARSTIAITRLGHYHVPNEGDGYCQTALVVGVDKPEIGPHLVNIVVWTKAGEDNTRLSVVVARPTEYPDRATFHLSQECPYGR